MREPLPEGFDPHGPLSQFALSVLDSLRRRHCHSVVGLENLPTEGPCLLVVNHSLATYDILMLSQTIYERLGRIPRGLGDKRLFQVPGLRQVVAYFGGVRASHDAADRLLGEGLIVLVAPGGMMEALRPSEKRYQVSWEDRKGFIRVALRTGAPIVLAACPKADDLYDVRENDLTRRIYERFHLPIPFLSGEGGGLLPRAVRLTHTLSEPIRPPPLAERDDIEPYVDPLHLRVVDRMNSLMTEALAAEEAREHAEAGLA